MSQIVRITFERSLSSEEENKLIGRLKGFREDVRDGLIDRANKLLTKQKFLNAIAIVGAQASTVRLQLEAACTKTIGPDGKESCPLDAKFALEKLDEKQYRLTFPNISDLVSMPGGKGIVKWSESATRNEIGGVRQMIEEAGLGGIVKEVAHAQVN